MDQVMPFFETLPPREARIMVTALVVMGALGNAMYGVVALNRFAMVVGIIGFLYALWVSHSSFEDE